ncbi:MAG TPA: dienelactone hydrolase family protein [archaeon]|nr:dienelactone hydrolase family protein [archaeon]
MTSSEKHELIDIKADSVRLEGMLEIPRSPRGIVLFAHGSGSSRHSKRNQYVAEILRVSGIGTLLFDLLTYEEAEDRTNVFDIDLLAQRLLHATDWIMENNKTKNLKIGYFGASTGAAAALKASIVTPNKIRAVVSRGGRPDMVIPVLKKVKSPTLLIVGGNDFEVITLNQAAYDELQCEKELKIIPGATHLFEEPGKMEEVAELAKQWFTTHFK